MMLKLLLWAYSTGVTSSREIERRGHVDVAFRWLAANAAPDYRSVSRFRRRHLGALDSLFVQVLALCAEAGLVRLGRVALDGTKLRACASRHKAMSHERLGPRIEALGAEVAAMLAEAEAIDQAEDEAGEAEDQVRVGQPRVRQAGTLYAAMTAQLQAKQTLLPLLLFPLIVPALLASVKATSLVILGDPMGELRSWLGLLAAFDLIYWSLCGLLYGRVIDN